MSRLLPVRFFSGLLASMSGSRYSSPRSPTRGRRSIVFTVAPVRVDVAAVVEEEVLRFVLCWDIRRRWPRADIDCPEGYRRRSRTHQQCSAALRRNPHRCEAPRRRRSAPPVVAFPGFTEPGLLGPGPLLTARPCGLWFLPLRVWGKNGRRLEPGGMLHLLRKKLTACLFFSLLLLVRALVAGSPLIVLVLCRGPTQEHADPVDEGRPFAGAHVHLLGRRLMPRCLWLAGWGSHRRGLDLLRCRRSSWRRARHGCPDDARRRSPPSALVEPRGG
jgi:hypothetical protein